MPTALEIPDFMPAAPTPQDRRLSASPRLLAACLLASVALHVLLLALPGWRHEPADDVPRTLDVALRPSAEPAPAPPPASRPAPVPATRPATRQPPRVIAVAPPSPSARAEMAAAPVAETTLPAASDSAGPADAAPAAVAVKPEAGPVQTPPSFSAAYLRNPPPRYPPAARRNGDEGTVLLRVRVAADGAAVQVELDRSSGFPLLDGAALDAVRGWRFVPARRGTLSVEDWVRVPVVFRLES
jgi:protein TonB